MLDRSGVKLQRSHTHNLHHRKMDQNVDMISDRNINDDDKQVTVFS